MKFYLSSFKFGDDLGKSLQALIPSNNKIGMINNARDHSASDQESRLKNQVQEFKHLERLGFAGQPYVSLFNIGLCGVLLQFQYFVVIDIVHF